MKREPLEFECGLVAPDAEHAGLARLDPVERFLGVTLFVVVVLEVEAERETVAYRLVEFRESLLGLVEPRANEFDDGESLLVVFSVGVGDPSRTSRVRASLASSWPCVGA